MNRWIALLLVAGFLAVPAVAQAPEELVLVDPTGDVLLDIQGAAAQPSDQFPGADLVELKAFETEETISWAVTTLAAPTSPQDSVEIFVFFTHGLQYRVDVLSITTAFGPRLLDAGLRVYDEAAGEFQFIRTLDLQANGGTYEFETARDDLRDASGATLSPGRALVDIHATSRGLMESIINTDQPTPIHAGLYGLNDRLPDSDGGTLDIRLGLRQSGDAFLHAAEPMRASNGEAGDFYFRVEAGNLGTPQTFSLRAVSVPADWQIAFESTTIEVDGAAEFLVRASIPFSHQHGAAQTFLVEMHGQDDAGDIGRVELGVYFLDVPQPTGHHNTIYIHSRQPGGDAFTDNPAFEVFRGRGAGVAPFMSAMSDDPANAGLPAAGDQSTLSIGFDEYESSWLIPLAPQLRIGLDLDTNQRGELAVTIDSVRPMDAARIGGGLYLVPPEVSLDADDREGWILLATFASDPVAVAAQSTTGFVAVVAPTQASDYVPYQRGARLFADVVLHDTSVDISAGAERPLLLPGGSLRLPLLEYSDRVADASGFVALEAELEEAAAVFDEGSDEVEDASAAAAMFAGSVLAMVALAARRR